MKGKILVFGTKFDLLDRIRNLGYDIILVNYTNSNLAGDFIQLDPELAKEGAYDVSSLDNIKNKNINGIVVCDGFYWLLASKVCEKYFKHLNTLNQHQASISIDKLLLKESLVKNKIPTTSFIKLTPVLTLTEIINKIGKPFLIKPRRSCLARGIHVVRSESDWHNWIERADNLEAYYAEEYLTNFMEYCCDTLISNGKVIAQFPGEYTINCLESNLNHSGIGVNFPGFLPPEEIQKLKDLAAQFLINHKFKNGFCHIEFFYDKSGWKLGEIGHRLPGGYQIPTESYIAKKELKDLYIQTCIDTEPSPQNYLHTDNRYLGYYLYPKKVGAVKKIHTDINYPWIVEAKVHIQEGQEIAHEDSSVTNAAHIVYTANNIDELKKKSDEVNKLIQIEYV